MEVITFESEAYKALVGKIEKIAGYVAEAQLPSEEKKEAWLAGQQPTGGSVGDQYTYIATPEG